MRNKKTQDMVLVSVFTAIIFILAFIPGVGYIPLGAIRATIIHIPVIIGGILLGPVYGAFLGGMFGLTSFLSNTFSPVLTSFVFTPFYSIGTSKGNLWSIVICFVPRILIGVVSYYVFHFCQRLLKKHKNTSYLSYFISGVLGSLTNTILVMNLIYFCFGAEYSAVKEIGIESLYYTIITVIAVNGIPEAIAAGVITTAVCAVLYRMVVQNRA